MPHEIGQRLDYPRDMPALKRVFYLLPLLIAATTLIPMAVLETFGADCTDWDGVTAYECNALGDVGWTILAVGAVLFAIVLAVWIPTMAVLAVVSLRRGLRSSPARSAPNS